MTELIQRTGWELWRHRLGSQAALLTYILILLLGVTLTAVYTSTVATRDAQRGRDIAQKQSRQAQAEAKHAEETAARAVRDNNMKQCRVVADLAKLPPSIPTSLQTTETGRVVVAVIIGLGRDARELFTDPSFGCRPAG